MEKKLGLPITGIASFAKYPICNDLKDLEQKPVFGILGIPYDLGVGFLSGTRLGPRRIREASTQYGRGSDGFYNPEDDEVYLQGENIAADFGDVDVVANSLTETQENISIKVRSLIRQGIIPVILGGDHSISIGVSQGLDKFSEITAIQIDAHLDWSHQELGNGSPMRRMSEMNHISKMVQIGLRGVGSSKKSDFIDAKNYGDVLISREQLRRMGIDNAVKLIPESKYYYVTIDIDAFDISIASGTGSPMPNGLMFEEVDKLLKKIAQKNGKIVAFDFVEVAPQYDPTNSTVRVAAMTILNFMGYILKNINQ